MRFLFIILIILIPLSGISQDNILENSMIQQQIESCLDNTYNYNFKYARSLQKEIKNTLPEHPVTDFLYALIIYWENMPLLPDDKQTDEFLRSMEKSISRSKELLKNDPDHLEGVFFDLHARAFTAMFWADNGEFRRVLKDIDKLYRRTMQGIDKKGQFNEFYFSSGLYSYYIKAYLETHPVYKPIAVLFRKGDMEQGLRELQYAIDSATYIKVEAIHFMSLLQLNYEENMPESLKYASILHNKYPNNTYYTGRYVMILMYQQEFEQADSTLQELEMKDDTFSKMLVSIFKGFIAENDEVDLEAAKMYYRHGIKIAEEFGPFADMYQAIAYTGLARLHEYKGEYKIAKKQRKLAESLSKYKFIHSFQPSALQ